MLKLAAVALLLFAAPPKKPKGPPPPEDPCSPEKLKLDDAKKLIAFDLPKDCKPKPPAVRVLVRSAKDFSTRVVCDAKAVAGVDWSKVMLVVMQKEHTTATVGHDVYDEDGRRVTVVARQQGTCPRDAAPTAQTSTVAFLMPTDPNPPEFGDASCTLPTTCK